MTVAGAATVAARATAISARCYWQSQFGLRLNCIPHTIRQTSIPPTIRTLARLCQMSRLGIDAGTQNERGTPSRQIDQNTAGIASKYAQPLNHTLDRSSCLESTPTLSVANSTKIEHISSGRSRMD